MSTIGIQRIVDGTLTSADSATLTIQNSLGTIIVSAVTITPTSAGVYSRDVTSLAPGRYTATWTFVVSGMQNDVVSRRFDVDSAQSTVKGIRLMDIERSVARRVGPYRLVAAGPTNTTTSLGVTKMRSSLDFGDWEDLYMLRRGLYNTGAMVTNFDESDRVRRVAAYDSPLGALTPDRAWTVAPVENEEVELMMLDPDEELRVAVVEGLSRCYFWDMVQMATTTYLRELDLSTIAPWITRPEQVRRVTYGRYYYQDQKAPWFNVIQRGNIVYLQTAIPAIGTMNIAALRPHSTFVNGETSYGGPDSDMDTLFVDKRYAVIAGHMTCWEYYPEELQPVATAGLRPSKQEVATEFTTRSLAIVKQYPEVIQNQFGQEADIFDNLQIGNA